MADICSGFCLFNEGDLVAPLRCIICPEINCPKKSLWLYVAANIGPGLVTQFCVKEFGSQGDVNVWMRVHKLQYVALNTKHGVGAVAARGIFLLTWINLISKVDN